MELELYHCVRGRKLSCVRVGNIRPFQPLTLLSLKPAEKSGSRTALLCSSFQLSKFVFAADNVLIPLAAGAAHSSGDRKHVTPP